MKITRSSSPEIGSLTTDIPLVDIVDIRQLTIDKLNRLYNLAILGGMNNDTQASFATQIANLSSVTDIDDFRWQAINIQVNMRSSSNYWEVVRWASRSIPTISDRTILDIADLFLHKLN